MALAKKENRELRIHALDVRLDPTTSTPLIMQLGNDNTELTRTQAWNTTSEKVVTGAIAASSTRGEESMSVEPFYCRKGDPTALLLQNIDENELELDDIKRYYYEAKVDEDGTTLYAFKKTVDVKPTSFGGSSDNADTIPFELAFSGKKIPVNFDFDQANFETGDMSAAFTEITP